MPSTITATRFTSSRASDNMAAANLASLKKLSAVNEQMRIAHFSDFHICPELGSNWQIAKIMEMIADARKRGAEQFVFTGDFVDYANLDDLSRLYREFRRAGLDHTNTTIIPGNHDIFPIPGCGLSHRQKASHGLRMIRGNAQSTHNSFVRRSSFLLKGTTPIWQGSRFPFIRKLSKEVLLVGLDTTNARWTGRFQFAQGSFDPVDAEAILEVLNSKPYAHCKRRILAIHHHPWAEMDLRGCDFEDVKMVQAFIAHAGFDLVLCGHVHLFDQIQMGKAMVVCSACHFERGQDVDCVGYHLITLGRSIRVKAIDCK